MASISAAAVADELPCMTNCAPSSIADLRAVKASSVCPLLSNRSSAKGRLPPDAAPSFTPPRALTRSTAQIRLRNTASPVLENGPLKLSIMAILIGAGDGCAISRSGAPSASSINFKGLTRKIYILKSLLNTAASLTDSMQAEVRVERRAVYPRSQTMFFTTTAPAQLRRQAYSPSSRSLERFLTEAQQAGRQTACAVVQDEKSYTLTFDVPGVAKDQLNIGIEGSI